MRPTSGTSRDGSNGWRACRREADLLFRRLLVATYFVEVGLLLLLIPWSSFWDRNTLLEAMPVVHAWTRSPYVRGAVSGLGTLNLGAGIVEAWSAWRAWLRSRRTPATGVRLSGEGHA
jgi:hypothetical protein